MNKDKEKLYYEVFETIVNEIAYNRKRLHRLRKISDDLKSKSNHLDKEITEILQNNKEKSTILQKLYERLEKDES